MAQINSVVTTYHTNAQTRLERYVDKEIYMLYPNVGTLLTFLSDPQFNNKKSETPQSKFEWYEDDMTARWAVAGATTVTNESTATTLNVTDGTLWVSGDLGYIPQAIGISTCGEIFRVVSVSSNNLTVIRSVNSILMTVNAAAPIAILGPAYEENSARPSPKQTTPAVKVGYTQIFRHSFSFSGTQLQSTTYGAPNGEKARIKLKRFQEHKRDINRAFVWGAATESFTAGPTGYPIRTTAGINSVIATNLVDASTTLTKSKWETFMQTAFQYGDSDTKILVASPRLLGCLTTWAESYLHLVPGTTEYGLNLTKLVTAHGNLIILRDQMLEDSTTTAGFAGWGFVLNPDDLEVKVMKNRDTKYIEYGITEQNGVDGEVGEYMSDLGLMIRNEKHHSKIYNVVAAA